MNPVYRVDVEMSPVFGLLPIRSGSGAIVTSYRIRNYGVNPIFVDSVKLQLNNPASIITSVNYRFLDNLIWKNVSTPNSGLNNVFVKVNRKLESGEATPDFNVQISTGTFSGSAIGVLTVPAIMSSGRTSVPTNQNEIRFQLMN
jgi:hypothetical protein